MSSVLIDATWWFGGNKHRGIGEYLQYFFLHVFSTPPESRLWLLPDTVSEKDRTTFEKVFLGETILFPIHAQLPQQWVAWERIKSQKAVKSVFIPSPFERPWSLLYLQNKLFEETKVEALIFDLLPLQYPKRILSTWSEQDQKEYKQRLTLLEKCQRLFAISPSTAAQMKQHLSYPQDKITLLEFGLNPQWVRPPTSIWAFRQRTEVRPFVLTISGGEWRKNLLATIEYFSRAFPPEVELQIICQLSFREACHLRWIALKNGVFFRMRLCGYVTEKVKWQKLSQAESLLFLSRAEGLGIPLLEAQAAGVPRVIISRNLEKAGHGILCPPFYEVAL